MRRVSICEKTGLRKGSWDPEEDKLLSSYIKRYGHGNWRELPKYAGLSRCGKSCRLRWMNYLRPNIKRGNFTKEEDDIIVNYFEKFGSRWSVIAATLPGRTDNEIKNRWHTNLKKGIEIERSQMPKRSERKLVKGEKLSTKGNSFNCDSVNIQILKSCPIFTPVSSERSCESSIFSSDSDEVIDEFPAILSELDESFWTELFSVDNDQNATFDSLLGLTFSLHNKNLGFFWSFL